MGGGDLNLKKSWHPMLMSNQKKVWEEEQKALGERKKIDQMMKERAEERQIQELQELQEAAGGKKRQQRVDWMYSGPATGQAGTTEEMDGYLLGKRRIDGLLKGTENQKLEKQSKEDAFMATQSANSMRDIAAKVREDPMLAIKKQEQAAYEAMMNDPVKRRMLLKAAGHDVSSEREHKRRKHHHRDSDRERSYRRHSSRRDEDGGEHRHRSRRNEDRDRLDNRIGYRRRSPSDSSSRSGSPRRRSRRSPSPHRKRSYSPSNRHHDTRSRSPYQSRPSNSHSIHKSKSWHNTRPGPRNSRRSSSPNQVRIPENQANDAAARLAAMQADASELDQQRQRRLHEIAERERAEADRLELERARNAKYGGRATFVDSMHKKAGDLTLGDRIGRNGHANGRISGDE